ncbi:MAG TPA: hypothetical protein VNZ26_12345, partial [Vicinamibacterales bacterium]|nr:hypothetical protein [Vicinamibacterales bacterium]
MGMISSVICLFGGSVAGSVGAPAIHKMPAIVELLSPFLRSALSALTGFPLSPMERDRSGRWCWRTDALRLIIKQYQDRRFWLYHRAMAALRIQLDRARRTPLAAQIYSAIREGIENGRLASGARLPSWQDLAA